MWTFGRKVAFGFALALVLFVVIGMVSFRTLMNLDESATWVSHTHEVLEHIERLLAQVIEAQSAVRGNVITGDDSMVVTYRDSVKEVPTTLAELKRLTADNPSQQERLKQLEPLIAQRLDELRRTIDLREKEGIESARKFILDQGRITMGNLRQLALAMSQEERQLLRTRDAESAASSVTARNVIIWGTVLCALIVALAGFFIVRSVVKQIGEAVQRVQSSSAELQAAATQQASGSRESATAMNEISTTISELLATSRQISDSSRRVSQVAEETFTAARSGDQLVGRAHESINAIKRQVDVIVSHMLDLGKRSQQIGGILELVGELAEQTNILAINASIEAAGAGDSGKRFGVVADEIRKLADRVGGSTKDIRSLIDDMRAAVNATVMATESGTKTVEAGARQFNDVTGALNNIARMVGTAAEAAKEIELSTKQQTTAVEQVNIAVSNVSKATKETETSSGQTLQTATFLSSLSGELTRMIRPVN